MIASTSQFSGRGFFFNFRRASPLSKPALRKGDFANSVPLCTIISADGSLIFVQDSQSAGGFMSILMNQAQRTSVFVALRTFEQYLRQLDRWLHGLEADGILYRYKMELPFERRALMQQKIATGLALVEDLAQTLQLEPEVIDLVGAVRGQMSESWANLIDSHAAKLHRYGEVDPGLSQPLDPAIDRLAQIASELAKLAA
jgi:hypothetical protein